jgi:MinD superfamily P-loop ATPase
MIITIASGKGGTGKTLVSTNLAAAVALSGSRNITYMDCDVEEPNGHIFLKPKLYKTEAVNISVPVCDKEKCDYCGKCAEVCQFNAILAAKKMFLVFEEMCHGCGSCILVCPKRALTEKKRKIGVVESGISVIKENAQLAFSHGKLNIGEPMAPPIIKALKKHINKEDLVILDAPPGTSCPVVETIANSDFVVLVTEPTPFGLHDLKLAVDVVRKLDVPFGVVVNKSGIGNHDVNNFCDQEKIQILLSIPHDKKIAHTYSKGELLVTQSNFKAIFNELYQHILEAITQ